MNAREFLAALLPSGSPPEGAAVLGQVSLTNPSVGAALIGLGVDPETGDGYDLSGPEIGGHWA